jgi:hypothetical protein
MNLEKQINDKLDRIERKDAEVQQYIDEMRRIVGADVDLARRMLCVIKIVKMMEERKHESDQIHL